MDVVRLGERYTSDYMPDQLIEGYESAIFTERSSDYGDFEIKTRLVDKHKALLPEDTMISHLDTDNVWIVETLLEEEDDEGDVVLTISGRTAEFFVEHRFIEAPYQKKRLMAAEYTPVGAAAVLLWNAFDNGSGKDVTWERDKDVSLPQGDLDRLPNIAITDSAVTDGTAGDKWLEQGELGAQLRALMERNDLILRVIRPSKASTAQVISVDVTPLSARGTVHRTSTSGITAMRFDIYRGLDRTEDQSTNPKVKFSRLQGDLDKPQRLRSFKDFKTALEVMSSVEFKDVYRNNTEKALGGWRRRVMSFDAGAPDIPSEPQRPKPPKKNAGSTAWKNYRKARDDWLDDHAAWENKRDNIVARFKTSMADDNLRALKPAKKVNVLTADVSPLAPYQFKRDYDCGDKVTVYDLDGSAEDMIVAEYTRKEDVNGDVGYPGLILPE